MKRIHKVNYLLDELAEQYRSTFHSDIEKGSGKKLSFCDVANWFYYTLHNHPECRKKIIAIMVENIKKSP